MDEAQGAGEVMALALIDHADLLGKSARATQQTLEKQIGELVAMEARVKTAVQSIHGAVKSLEAERVKMEAERAKLQAVGPALEQNAVWAMRETLREQAGEIKREMRTEVSSALVEPLANIQRGARHVREQRQGDEVARHRQLRPARNGAGADGGLLAHAQQREDAGGACHRNRPSPRCAAAGGSRRSG